MNTPTMEWKITRPLYKSGLSSKNAILTTLFRKNENISVHIDFADCTYQFMNHYVIAVLKFELDLVFIQTIC